MIQILVCDKVYVTPEMRRKKVLYKLYFILSVILVIALLGYYLYQEYDRDASEQVSQEILEGIHLESIVADSNYDYPDDSVSVENNVIVVVLNDNSEEEINVDQLIQTTQNQIKENEMNTIEAKPLEFTAKDGTKYYVTAIIKIPKLNITYPVLSDWSDDLLNNAPCRYMGPERVNMVGNFVILGHNYRNEKKNQFFTNIHKLEIQDKIELTDVISGKTAIYTVYEKQNIEDDDLRCLDQNTNGQKIVTLITCYNYGKQRTYIKAIAE